MIIIIKSVALTLLMFVIAGALLHFIGADEDV